MCPSVFVHSQIDSRFARYLLWTLTLAALGLRLAIHSARPPTYAPPMHLPAHSPADLLSVNILGEFGVIGPTVNRSVGAPTKLMARSHWLGVTWLLPLISAPMHIIGLYLGRAEIFAEIFAETSANTLGMTAEMNSSRDQVGARRRGDGFRRRRRLAVADIRARAFHPGGLRRLVSPVVVAAAVVVVVVASTFLIRHLPHTAAAFLIRQVLPLAHVRRGAPCVDPRGHHLHHRTEATCAGGHDRLAALRARAGPATTSSRHDIGHISTVSRPYLDHI